MKKIGGIISLVLASFLLLSPAYGADLFNKDLRYGMVKNSDTKRLQTFLREEGYYTGPISGNFYGMTQTAVIKFQKKNNIKPFNGRVSVSTRSKINNMLLAKEVYVTPEISSETYSTDNNVENTSIPQIISNEQSFQEKALADMKARMAAYKPSTEQPSSQPQVTQPEPVKTVVAEEPKKEEVKTVPEPVSTNITVQRNSTEYGTDKLTFLPTGENFKMEAFVISGSSVEVKAKISSSNFQFYYNNGNTNSNKIFGVKECMQLEKLFQEFSSRSFPYSCPSNGYGMSEKDWMGRDWQNIVLEKDSILYVPKESKVEYIKLVGQTSGKIVEFSNI